MNTNCAICEAHVNIPLTGRVLRGQGALEGEAFHHVCAANVLRICHVAIPYAVRHYVGPEIVDGVIVRCEDEKLSEAKDDT